MLLAIKLIKPFFILWDIKESFLVDILKSAFSVELDKNIFTENDNLQRHLLPQ